MIKNKCTKCGHDDPKDFHEYRPTRCKKCLADIQRLYRKKRPKGYWKHKDKKYTLKKRYGLSIDDFEKRILEQNNKCEICNIDPSTISYSINRQLLHVDHNHKTGKIRGLICNGCNRALGFINDNIEIAKSIVLYLEKYKS